MPYMLNQWFVAMRILSAASFDDGDGREADPLLPAKP